MSRVQFEYEGDLANFAKPYKTYPKSGPFTHYLELDGTFLGQQCVLFRSLDEAQDWMMAFGAFDRAELKAVPDQTIKPSQGKGMRL